MRSEIPMIRSNVPGDIRKRQSALYSVLSLAVSLPLTLLSAASVCADGGETPLDQAKVDFFETKIRPVLIERCYECHSGATGDPGGEFRLDTASLMRKGGSMGAPLEKDAEGHILLLQALEYDDSSTQMPPTGKLPDHIIQDFKTWIEQGAVDPRTDESAEPAAKSKAELAAEHWAFQPLPEQIDQSKSIDSFIDEKLASQNIEPNPQATQRELIRRLYYDLIGLAPTYDEMIRLESEPIENYEKWVDKLIDSKHFGERMARRWMDVARYADNKGYVFNEDREYYEAWKYRSWLIESFNNDRRFDEFANLQMASDKIDPGANNENLHAMGFLTLGRRFLNNRYDIADDRIDLVTRGFMGLSVACARCHDHKFDPISMADYYSLQSAFLNSNEPKDAPSTLRLVDNAEIKPAVILKRGQAGQPGDQVPRKFIQFVSSVSRPMENGSGRIDLAQAITDAKNPLTARVIVNRVWGWVVGTPLVDTPSDFGLRTPEPLQSDLLDHLAAEFIADGQSIKRLIKRIVMTDVYRRSSTIDDEKQNADPQNLYWWRGVRKRVDFESIRDSILVATNQLNPQVGGKSVKIVNKPFSNRRTVYAYIDRQNLEGLFRSFDFASPEAHVANRLSTTVPQQALFMMNSSMIDHYATRFAEQLFYSEEGQRSEWVINQMFRSILKRDPSDQEFERISNYLKDIAGEGPVEVSHIATTAKALLCTNEFCFID